MIKKNPIFRMVHLLLINSIDSFPFSLFVHVYTKRLGALDLFMIYDRERR